MLKTSASLPPPPPWLPRLIARWHATRCTVISLNYDTLVEKTLTDVQEPGKRWAGAAYPIALPLIGSRTHALYSPPNGDTFKLAKLHGSVNWCYSGSPKYFGEQIYDLGITFGWSSEPTGNELTIRAPDKVPLIVPPTTTKSTFFSNETVQGLWRTASRALDDSDAVFCIGYSLPVTDLLIRFLLASAGRQLQIGVVNRDPGAAAHYRQLLYGHRITQMSAGDEAVAEFAERF